MKTRFQLVLGLEALAALCVGGTFGCSSSETGSGPGGHVLDGGGTGGVSGNGSGGKSGSSGSTGQSSPVGKSCLVDSDCLSGLTCLPATGSDLGGGGPPGGLCTVACGADQDCATFDPTATCLGVTASTAYCFQSCTIGDMSATKCNSRLDMSCNEPVDNNGAPVQGAAYCSPTCRGDFDCKGRKCDLSLGTCVDSTQSTGKLPIGSKCDPNGTTDQCTGVCVSFLSDDGGPNGTSICSGVCSLGNIGCGQDPNAPPPDAACGIPITMTSSTGDAGFCAQLCDCDGDCLYPGFVCQTFPAQAKAALGRGGQCTPLLDQNGKPVPHTACTPGGKEAGAAGGASGAGGSKGTGGRATADAGPDGAKPKK